jgi:hypothetical protein
MVLDALQRLKASFSGLGQMIGAKKAAKPETRCYSDSEIDLMRQQLRVGNAEADKVMAAKGYTLDPRIADARAEKASS